MPERQRLNVGCMIALAGSVALWVGVGVLVWWLA